MSNGFVPAKRVESIERSPLVQEIVAMGRWSSVKLDGIEGYEIHDYLKHQNNKAKIEEVREKNREKLSLYRASKREAEIARLRVTVGVTDDVTELHTVGVTTPEDEDENEDQFEKFWNLYPRKDGKKGARVSFEKALKISSLEVILEGVTRYIQFLKTATQDTAMPATWLNGERWNDQNSSPALAWNSATPEVPHKRIVDPKTFEPYCESCGQTWPCNAEQRVGGAEF